MAAGRRYDGDASIMAALLLFLAFRAAASSVDRVRVYVARRRQRAFPDPVRRGCVD